MDKRQNSQAMIPHTGSKIVSLGKERSAVVKATTSMNQTVEPVSKRKLDKSYHIKMKKGEKERYEKVYSSRSGRYSRMSGLV